MGFKLEGRYSLYLETRDRVYDFLFDKQVSILTGDSSTGKSEFLDLLRRTVWESWYGNVADYKATFNWVYVLGANTRSEKSIIATIGEENVGTPGLLVIGDTELFYRMEWSIDGILSGLDCYILMITRRLKDIRSVPQKATRGVYTMETGKLDDKYLMSLKERKEKQIC